MRKKNCFVSVIIALVMCFCAMYSFCTIVVKADEMPLIETIPIEDVFS